MRCALCIVCCRLCCASPERKSPQKCAQVFARCVNLQLASAALCSPDVAWWRHFPISAGRFPPPTQCSSTTESRAATLSRGATKGCRWPAATGNQVEHLLFLPPPAPIGRPPAGQPPSSAGTLKARCLDLPGRNARQTATGKPHRAKESKGGRVRTTGRSSLPLGLVGLVLGAAKAGERQWNRTPNRSPDGRARGEPQQREWLASGAGQRLAMGRPSAPRQSVGQQAAPVVQ